MQFFSYAHSLMAKGGPVMVPILLLSVVGWALAAERLWRFFKRPKDREAESFARRVQALVRDGQWRRAEAECRPFDHPLARVFLAGLASRELAREDLKTRLEKAANREIRGCEQNLGGLLTIIGVEPLLGFLGTITGLIKSFQAWERLADRISVSALAAGIHEAMITTAAGLAVAIPLYVIYQYLVSRIDRTAQLISDEGDELLIALSSPAPQAARR